MGSRKGRHRQSYRLSEVEKPAELLKSGNPVNIMQRSILVCYSDGNLLPGMDESVDIQGKLLLSSACLGSTFAC